MSWYWWMFVGAALALVARALLPGLASALRPVRTCSWCERTSGFQVLGHGSEECQGPRAERREEDRRHAEKLSQRAQRKRSSQDRATAQAERAARHEARLRLIQVGKITTRCTARGNSIDLTGWIFDRTSGPGPISVTDGSLQSYLTTGAPERVHGWTLPELHALAHGGSCPCDVMRLARNAAY
ncbi:hypothetical protein [Streptomyces lutosisoli]|uniref:Secreted protein n=1 Tax=Streptomyces lutosisoli TaxID=2665721 RepID=A0ABW2VUR9_9ACTN